VGSSLSSSGSRTPAMTRIETTADLRALLTDLAFDLAFASTPEAEAVFSRLDPAGFEGGERNLVALLAALPERRLEEALGSGTFAVEVERLVAEPRDGRGPGWWTREHGAEPLLVAYFCMEFGVHESLPVYAGGLGVLAGDHLKAASTLGVPLVAVGLLYRRGYFRQVLDEAGRQVERYPTLDRGRLPLTLERSEEGSPLLVEVELGDERVAAQIWRARVGSVPLYLLDADIEENSAGGRSVTDVLYGGDREHRLRQELLLGVRPTVFHANEGHAAFLALERMRILVEDEGLAADEARELVRASTVFTTHTPVPAGNEVFPPDLVVRHVGRLAGRAGLSTDELLALGSGEDGATQRFGMTELALRTSARANAVSALHGDVSRSMWRGHKDQITHVTNAVHAPTWISGELAGLLRASGVRLDEEPARTHWEQATEIDGATLWEVHRRRKAALLAWLAERAAASLDPEALTIGFARRFAAYKRASLVFSEPERIFGLIGDGERPVQLVFAGKAHPADAEGKALIEALVGFARDARAGGRIVVVEDYAIEVAKLLVQGVDLWLTTPRRPNEASGTSGMKAGMNGVPNLSVLDGWWPEGYSPEIGWAVGERYSELGDEAEAAELLRLLEEEVVPAFYERDESGFPRRWVEMMKVSIARVGRQFSAERMVVDYVERLYLPAHEEAGRSWPSPAAASSPSRR
jgi:glycogen phosphorylase